jgi:hypothetical protein
VMKTTTYLPEKDQFIGPPKSSIIGDINTGQCYQKTNKALVKNPAVDTISPKIVAMDKTQVDTYGRLQMEPLWFTRWSTNQLVIVKLPGKGLVKTLFRMLWVCFNNGNRNGSHVHVTGSIMRQMRWSESVMRCLRSFESQLCVEFVTCDFNHDSTVSQYYCITPRSRYVGFAHMTVQ